MPPELLSNARTAQDHYDAFDWPLVLFWYRVPLRLSRLLRYATKLEAG